MGEEPEEPEEAEEVKREPEEVKREPEEEGLLLPRETLLSAGIHIGTRMKTKDMIQFIYRVRPDSLFVLDIKKTDERVRVASKFLARFEPSKIVVVASRTYSRLPTEKFAELTGAQAMTGRFIPGSFSNPLYADKLEPQVVLVSDPRADYQAVKEASALGLPVVALCSTDNEFEGVDLIIPTNNKGKRALAMIYWLLARQVLRERGDIPPDGDLSSSVDDFEAKLVPEQQGGEE